MAEKAVIVDFDFAALDGAALLFETTRRFLKRLDGISLDAAQEARHLAGRTYLEGLQSLFAVVKTKKTAAKAARELPVAFAAALAEALPKAVTAAFRNFVKTFVDQDIAVLIRTRADLETARAALAQVLGPNVCLVHEESDVYGSIRWESWCRSYMSLGVSRSSSVAVTGSGFGVRSAVLVGVSSVAVVREHVAYQDFGGANAEVGELSGKTAKTILKVLHVA